MHIFKRGDLMEHDGEHDCSSSKMFYIQVISIFVVETSSVHLFS